MTQLELFSGPHLPVMRCLAALDAGDLRGACEALGGVESADRDRLATLEARLAAATAAREVHAAFEAALVGPPAQVPAESWFRLYARRLAASLRPEPAARLRGWAGLHFRLAAGDGPEALGDAQRLVGACRRGWAWLEAARIAWAVGEAERAARWLVVA